ncbi:MAG: hypothetical protein AB8B99_20445 [Phormidesmis sp.]
MTNSPFHDPQQNPLPDANDIEKEASIELYSLHKADNPPGPSPHIKKDIQRLRNALIGLLAIGATLGLVMGIFAAIILKRTGLLDPPPPIQRNMHEQSISIR